MQLSLRDISAIFINKEEFLKDMVSVGELVKYSNIVAPDAVGCAVEHATCRGKNVRENITKD